MGSTSSITTSPISGGAPAIVWRTGRTTDFAATAVWWRSCTPCLPRRPSRPKCYGTALSPLMVPFSARVGFGKPAATRRELSGDALQLTYSGRNWERERGADLEFSPYRSRAIRLGKQHACLTVPPYTKYLTPSPAGAKMTFQTCADMASGKSGRRGAISSSCRCRPSGAGMG